MIVRALASLALLLQARPEWVEISQQHYRKPTGPIRRVLVEPTTTHPSTVDLSDSSVTPHWAKGNVIRVAAGIGRVEHVTKPVMAKPANVNRRPHHKPGHRGTEATAHIKGEKPEMMETPSENIERRPTRKPVSRKDNMKQSEKQQVTRRPSVFTSTIYPSRSSRIPNRIYINGNEASSSKIPSVDEYFVTDKPTSTTESVKKSAATISKRIDSYAHRNPLINETSNNKLNNGYEYFVPEKQPTGSETKKSFITTSRKTDSSVARNPYGNINFIEQRPSKTQSNKQKYEEFTTKANNFRKPAEDFTSKPTVVPDEVSLDSHDLDIRRIDIASLVDPDVPDFITKQEFIYDDNDDEIKHLYSEHEETASNIPDSPHENPISDAENEEFSSEATIVNKETYYPHQDNGEMHIGTTHEHDDKFGSNITGEKKPNPIENVIKFMKVVSETISKNTRRGIKSKVKYLEDLRDNIMINIEHRIDEAWPEDDSAQAQGRGRAGRSTREARGHVDFPSSEGALMSISFLTFAVFLIKLIMQVIYKYKNQTMMVTPTVFAVSRAADATAMAARSKT